MCVGWYAHISYILFCLATSLEAPALDMDFPLALHIFAAGPHAALAEKLKQGPSLFTVRFLEKPDQSRLKRSFARI